MYSVLKSANQPIVRPSKLDGQIPNDTILSRMMHLPTATSFYLFCFVSLANLPCKNEGANVLLAQRPAGSPVIQKPPESDP
jgi:hypothetical protein